MKLEYLHDISDGGKYRSVVSEDLIRLYHPEEGEGGRLAKLIKLSLIEEDGFLDLTTLDFIRAVNCTLTLELSSESKGIIRTPGENTFACRLTKVNYRDIIEMIELNDGGYNWLCETSDDSIDFLYSQGGAW